MEHTDADTETETQKYNKKTEINQPNRGKNIYLVTMALKWSLYLAIERNLIQL